MPSVVKTLRPISLTRLHESRWPRVKTSYRPLTLWINRTHQATLWLQPDGQLVLSIARRDGRSGISWNTMQSIKTATGFGTWQAVEIFPPETELVYKANVRHLWLSHEPKAIGWHRA